MPLSRTISGPGLVTLAFGTAVAMWAVGYAGRLPGLQLPSPLLAALLIGVLAAGGFLAARLLAPGWRGGAAIGLGAGLLNLLVLGSFLADDGSKTIAPAALLWVPGFLAASAALGALGALAAGARDAPPREIRWTSAFARVTTLATALLLAVGGLVTSQKMGLAVVDWPNSYGYNMFLYPLSKMTGGVFYEHAHRLFGALVGLTTLAFAILLQRLDRRAWVRRLGWLAFAMVVAQGILGGLRVTGTLTLSQEGIVPNLTLAAVHGVFAQLFFGTLVALAAFTSATWTDRPAAEPRPGIRAARVLNWILLTLLVGQLILGAIQRHLDQLLPYHIALGALVAALGFSAGFRAWGNNPGVRPLQRCGIALILLVMVQVMLGMGAWILTTDTWAGSAASPAEVIVTTSHQWCGAILLATVVLIQIWSYRLVTGKR